MKINQTFDSAILLQHLSLTPSGAFRGLILRRTLLLQFPHDVPRRWVLKYFIGLWSSKIDLKLHCKGHLGSLFPILSFVQ